MSRILDCTATLGKYVVLHVTAIAIVITGVFMLLSASDLGPVAAFIVPMGLYLVFLGICIELLLGLRFVLAVVARHFRDGSAVTGAKAK